MLHTARTAKDLGAIVRRYRKDQGLTQAELGAKIGLRQATISKLELGAENTRLETLLDALTALELELRITARSKMTTDEFEQLF